MGRYKSIVIAVGVLVGANAIGQILGWHRVGLSDDATVNVGLAYLAIIVVVMAVVSYLFTVRYPSSRAIPDIGLVLLISCAIVVLIMPFLGDLQFLHHTHYLKYLRSPFIGGAGLFFGKIWKFLGAGLIGVVIGTLLAMALGKDYRARALKNYSQRVNSRPRKVVRR